MLGNTLVQNPEYYLAAIRRRGCTERHARSVGLHLARFQGRDMGSPPEVEAALRSLPSGVRHAHYRSLVAWARWERRRGGDPWPTAIERAEPPPVPRTHADPVVLLPVELRVLLDCSRSESPDMVAPIALGAFCGLRSAECARLSPGHLCLDGPVPAVSLPSAVTKTRRRRMVDLPPAAVAWLEACPPADPILPANWRKLREKCGGWPRNALRHSCATYMLALGRSAFEVASALGNTPEVLLEHYAGLATRDTASAWFSILP